MAGLLEFDANGLNIADLRGIQHAVNLTDLDLSSNPLTNDSNLQLLAQLTRLERLDISRTELSILPNLSALTALLDKIELIAVSLENNPLTAAVVQNDLVALENAGAEVTFSYDTAVLQLMGPWSMESVTVNDGDVDMGDFFEWEEGAVAAHLMVFPHTAYKSEEVDMDGDVLYHETGFVAVDGSSVSVMVYTENGVDVTPYEAFAGTWTRPGEDLIMTAEDAGGTVVLTWTR